MKDITIYTNRLKQIFFIFLNLFLLYISYQTIEGYLLNGSDILKALTIVLALMALVFFINTIFRILDFLKNKILLKVDKDGIYIRNSHLALRPDFVSWDDIDHFEIQFVSIEGFISIYLKDNTSYLESLPFYRKYSVKNNLKNKLGAISISKDVSKQILLKDLFLDLQERLDR